jgi:hypothetical protein
MPMQLLDESPAEMPLASAHPVAGVQPIRAVNQLPPARESGGPAGPEPTRYGDWERRGRCIDF